MASGHYYNFRGQLWENSPTLPTSALVLDMHGVTDLLTPEEFQTLCGSCPVIILSYLYSRDLIDEVAERVARYPSHGAYACFSVDEEPGNKAWFLKQFQGRVIFVDDDSRHIIPTLGIDGVTSIHLTGRKVQLIKTLRAVTRNQWNR